jgi:predicted GTPase
VVVATDGKTFHVQGCTFIHDKTVRTMAAREAIQEGYSPCIRTRPVLAQDYRKFRGVAALNEVL